MLVGQEKLINKINSMSSLPRTILLLGKRGSGKDDICSYVAAKFNLKKENITDKLNKEYIDSMYLRVEPFLYVINARDLTIKDENVMLKFIEEPLLNSYIIITCDNKSQVLDTVYNRCQVWNMADYDYEYLQTLTDDPLILRIAKTPGDIEKLKSCDLNGIINICNKVFSSIKVANVANALSITNKVAFKDGDEGVDADLFIDLLFDTISNLVIVDANPILIDYYKLTSKLSNDRYNIKHVNKKNLIENYLLRLREV